MRHWTQHDRTATKVERDLIFLKSSPQGLHPFSPLQGFLVKTQERLEQRAAEAEVPWSVGNCRNQRAQKFRSTVFICQVLESF